jgi:small conductance mechanosensitive channel
MSAAAGNNTSAVARLFQRPEGIPEPLWELGLTVLVLIVAWLLSRLLVNLAARRISRHFRRPSLTRIALRGIRVGVFLLAFLAILRIYGLSLGNIALSVTVFSAVVGVVLAPIVGSIISGVFLLADQPYEIGDMVELKDTGQRGFIEDITLRYTKLFTLDNTFVVIPNGTIRDRDVINYSAEDTRTRQSIDVIITYESDIETARSLIESAARQVDVVIEGGPDIRIGAARYPAAPTCYIENYGDHGVNLRLRYWLKQPYRLLTTRSEIQDAIWTRLEGAEVEIAYPHSHLVFDETSGHLDVRMDGDVGERAAPDRGPATRDPPEGTDES